MDTSLICLKTTPHGGRGVFTICPIPKNTVVFSSPGPYASVIDRAFRKEVCSECFAYTFDTNHRTWSVKHEPAGVFFCSFGCRDVWLLVHRELEEKYHLALSRLGNSRRNGRGDSDWTGPVTQESIDAAWLNPPALLSFPPMSELELDSARFIVSAILQRHRYPETWKEVLNLQDNELLFTRLHPEMLESHLHLGVLVREATKAARILFSFDVMQATRQILARDYGNVFGLYEEKDDTEMFGFAMFTTASYFNHDCTPNIKKERKGRAMEFYTTRDVEAGEELCISYVEELDPVEKRQLRLKEWWFFECTCRRCRDDLAIVSYREQ